MSLPAPGQRPGPDREAGAGTVLTAGVAMVALLLVAAVGLLTQASVAASRAATAADLSALAAADAARGIRDGTPCVVANATVAQHKAVLASCEVQGEQGHIVQVQTEIRAVPFLPPAVGRARAGPPPKTSDRP
ncbi:hypothetical protein GC088_12250 [Arthrobacter sp. JZ12]|uniref:Rv3654c family TadE-like protein n=1 Tax=Arthrobacter sp. JZ12 TaxID=2654190 RepID=UPI002B481663|nr:Rv3654c family TadE-like protein [Arthrobacter sp. JZ12]WRH25763.1 hypothetical protein GC088_12250 [Arthrobacter sp. JZ12]